MSFFFLLISAAIAAPGFIAQFANPSPNHIPWAGELAGHGSNQIVINSGGTDMTLQAAIDSGLFSGSPGPSVSVQFVQAFRKGGSPDTGSNATNRKIFMQQGPRSAIIALNDVSGDPQAKGLTSAVYDGMACNTADGWHVTGCWLIVSGSDSDIFPFPNGCVTNDFDSFSNVWLSISCMRAVTS